MQRNARSIAVAYNPYVNRLAVLLAATIATSALLYGIFLLEAVAHTASRAAVERELRSLTAALGELQTDSLKKTKTLTLARAAELGFVKPTEVATVFATEANRTLSRGSF